MVERGWTTITLTDGRTIAAAEIIDHSIRLIWEEYEHADPYCYGQRFRYEGDEDEGRRDPRLDQPARYSIGYNYDLPAVLITPEKGWELLIGRVRCSNEWAGIVVRYQGKAFTQVCGSDTELTQPWLFREHLTATIAFHAPNRKIWPSKDASPRSALIVLSGLLLWRRP